MLDALTQEEQVGVEEAISGHPQLGYDAYGVRRPDAGIVIRRDRESLRSRIAASRPAVSGRTLHSAPSACGDGAPCPESLVPSSWLKDGVSRCLIDISGESVPSAEVGP